jgi:WD40 repeat protein
MSGRRLSALVLVLLTAPLSAQPRLDRPGEALPPGAKARLGALRHQHNRLVCSFTPSPDGRVLGVVSPGDVRLVEATTGRTLVRVRTPEGTFHALAFSGDGQHFVLVGYRDRQAHGPHLVLVGDAATGAVQRQFEVPLAGPYPCPQLSHDGRLLVLWSADQKGTAVVWDTQARVERWRTVTASRGLQAPVPCLLSPSGGLLAVAQEDGSVALRVADSGRTLQRLAAGPGAVRAMAFSPDGRTLAIGGEGAETPISVFDVNTGRLRRRLSVSVALVDSLAFSRDGKHLLLRTGDERLSLWDAATGRLLFRSPVVASHRAPAAVISPDGRTLAWIDETSPSGRGLSNVVPETWLPRGPYPRIHVWDIATGEELRHWNAQCQVSALRFTADGRTLLATGSSVVAFDADTGRRLPAYSGPLSALRWLEYAPDGKVLAALDDERGLYLWDAAGGRERPLEGDREMDAVAEVRFVDGGRLLIAHDITGTFRVWDCDSGTLRRQFQVAGDQRRWSADGRTLAAFSETAGTVQCWDVPAGRMTRSWEAHPGGVRTCWFAPDGRTVATSGADQTLAVWTWPAGEQLLRMPCPGWSAFAASDGGRFVAVADSTRLLLWDREERDFLWELPENAYPVGFSADGRTLVTSSGYVVSLRESLTGEESYRFARTDGNFSSIGLLPAPRGRLLARTQDMVHDLIANRPLLPAARWVPNASIDPTEPVALSPDGRAVAVGGRKVALADVDRARPLGWLPPGHEKLTTALAFRPDGRTLATGGDDGTVLLWDLRGLHDGWPAQLVTYPADDLEKLWERLGEAPPAEGTTVFLQPSAPERALQQLLAAPRQAVPFLAGKLKNELVANGKRVGELIGQLDADDFEKREEATRELAKMGRVAGPLLTAALKGAAPPETKRRIRELLEAHDVLGREPPGMLQGRAAVRILATLGTAPARRVLEEVGRGPNALWLGQEAAEALRRVQAAAR